MLKHIIYISLFITGAFSLSSCKKVININLNTSPNQIVIEGNITDQPGQQTIKISRSVPYTDSNAYPPVTGSVVTVTDDAGHSWTFSETEPGDYTFGPLKGEPGRVYTLKAVINNTTYTALSAMPEPVKLDSLSIKVFEFGGSEIKQVEVHYKDPVNNANQYRYVMKINGIQAKSIFAENDRFTNGNNVTSVLFNNSDNDDNEKLKTGDNVEIEMQCIDKNIFTYWYTLEQQIQNGPGGGVAPGNPPSNINNNALGYFSAHTTETKTITVN